jgi:ABC-2 type transport system permease protein
MNMHKLQLVARNTFTQQVHNRSFLILTLALPLVVVLSAVVPSIAAGKAPEGALGCVDLSGRLTLPSGGTIPADGGLSLVPMANEATAGASVKAGETIGYIVVPQDYMGQGRLLYYGDRGPTTGMNQALGVALRRAIAPDAPEWVLARLEEPAAWRYQDLETGRTLEQGLEVQLWALFPMAMGMMFILLLSITLSAVGPAVVREKEERSMEMILTSLSPDELVTGKLIGMTMLGLTQVAIWLGAAAVALVIMWISEGGRGVPTLRWPVLGWAALLGVPGYLLYAALAAGLGIMAGTREQARQTSGFLSVLAVAPTFILMNVLGDPDGVAAIAMSLFPPFAPTVTLFRMLGTEVPTWQLAAAVVLLWISVIVALWATARVYRASALLYGQNLSVRHIWRALVAGGAGRMA